MSDTTRIRVDLPAIDPQSAELVRNQIELLVRLELGKRIPNCAKAEVKLREFATPAELDAARADSRVDDDLEIDDDAERSDTGEGGDEGVWVSAWLFLRRDEVASHSVVTAERLQTLFADEGFPVPSSLEDAEALPDSYVAGALAYLTEMYGAECHIGNADLIDYMNDYATTQEEQA